MLNWIQIILPHIWLNVSVKYFLIWDSYYFLYLIPNIPRKHWYIHNAYVITKNFVEKWIIGCQLTKHINLWTISTSVPSSNRMWVPIAQYIISIYISYMRGETKWYTKHKALRNFFKQLIFKNLVKWRVSKYQGNSIK